VGNDKCERRKQMPVKPGEKIDAAATRQRILEASERTFSQRGITSVSIAEIADGAGASKATIYKNFGSKDMLVEATLRYRSQRVHRWLMAGTAHLAPGPSTVLGVFDLLLEWFAQDDFRGCAMVSAAAERRGTDVGVTQLARLHLQVYRDFLIRSLLDARVDDAERLADVVLVLIEGATAISAIDGNQRAGWQARDLARTLLEGWPLRV